SIAPAPDTVLDENSVHHRLGDLNGIHVTKSLKLNGNGLTTTDIFAVTGIVRVLLIEAYCIAVADATTLTGFKFQLWDGTAAVDITTGVSASGILVDAVIFKEGLVGVAAVLLNPTVGIVRDAPANKLSYEPFWVVKKTGAATTIRVSYTGDVSTDVDMTFEIHYVPVAEDAVSNIGAA
ncbi:hypothetical protein LCGC14_2600730, partial [marine sediment metagenome]